MNRSICVFCASSDAIDPRFFEVARTMGRLLAEQGDTLIWGGGKIGLMGEVARSVHAHGGRVVGVIPQRLTRVEIAYDSADELIVTQTMRERKHIMDERSDAFVVLPGGFGTLEELAEILVLRILKYHRRPIVLVNTRGFYDPLLELFRHFVQQSFARPKHLDAVIVVDHPEQVYPALESGLQGQDG